MFYEVLNTAFQKEHGSLKYDMHRGLEWERARLIKIMNQWWNNGEEDQPLQCYAKLTEDENYLPVCSGGVYTF